MPRLRRILLACLMSSAALAACGAEPGKLELLRRLVADDSPRVRVEALRALASVGTAEAADLALRVLEKPMDPTLDYALWLTINDLAEPWLAAVEAGEWKPEGRARQLEFALRALPPDKVGRVLGSVLGDDPLPEHGEGGWIELIGAAGRPADLRRLMEQAVSGGFNPAATVRALKALSEAARLRNARPEGDLSGLAAFLDSPDAEVRSEAIALAGRWGEAGGMTSVLLRRAGDPDLAPEERTLVFEALRQIGGGAVIQGLREFTGSTHPVGVRRAAAAALSRLDAHAGSRAALEVARGLERESDALDFWRAVLTGRESAAALREALDGAELPEAAARAGMRVAREGGRSDVELATAFARAGGVGLDAEALTGALIRDLAEKALRLGDAARGELVYRRAELACMTCHAIGGAGGKVGPDLASIGASAPMDYIVESMLLPSAKIKEGYHSVIIETTDGEEFSGTLARENQQEVVLRNAAGQEVSVAKANIATRENGRLSLMPSGLLDALEERERLDLFAFLGRLGKPGDYDASGGRVARSWRVANVVHTDLQNNQGDWYWAAPFQDRRWVPVYTFVNGELPGETLSEAAMAQAWTSKVAVILATEIEQGAAGPVVFRSGAPGAEIWLAQRRLGDQPEVRTDVPAGRHRVVLKFDPRRLPASVRLEAEGTVFVTD